MIEIRRLNIVVGFFTVLGVFVFVIALLWLSVGLNQDKYYLYKTTVNGTVDGLTINSVVKFNGVIVGKVVRMILNKRYPGQIIVFMDIASGTPITKNTYAQIVPQGITGLSYITIGLENLNVPGPLLLPSQYSPIPSIKSRGSLVSSITKKMDRIATSVMEMTKKMNQIITPKNVEAMNQMIENTSEFTNKINNGVVKIINWQLLPGLEKSVGKLNLILQNMDALTQKINQNPAILIRGEVDADHEA